MFYVDDPILQMLGMWLEEKMRYIIKLKNLTFIKIRLTDKYKNANIVLMSDKF